ncbi:hypothetical protein RPE78_16870 (plasmid) [Thioclava litoralis]|uniref:Uncharacterized protein n=1 Tax=Thioclava litoralis TaxID=3076557 RepID=A0ABZ1E5Z8_9RHOB|nr:hypothetical protein RPE78_16870 [Thioclava sp. FTW29]
MINDLTKLMEAMRTPFFPKEDMSAQKRRLEDEQRLRTLFADSSPAASKGRYSAFELELHHRYHRYGERAVALLSAVIMTDEVCAMLFRAGRYPDMPEIESDTAESFLADFEACLAEPLAHLLSLEPAPDLNWLLCDLFDWPQRPQTDPLEFAPERIKPLAEQFIARFPRHGGEALSQFFNQLPDEIAIDLVLDVEVEDAALAWLRLELADFALLYEAYEAENCDLPGYWIVHQRPWALLQFWPRSSSGRMDLPDDVSGLWFRKVPEAGLPAAHFILWHLVETRPYCAEMQVSSEHVAHLVVHDADVYHMALEEAFAAYDPSRPEEEAFDRAFAAIDALPHPEPVAELEADPVSVPPTPAARSRPDRSSPRLIWLALLAVGCLALALALLSVNW